MMEKNNKTEKCVSCGADTDVPVDQHIDLRKHYVEGAGQLCVACFNRIYGTD